ncbi:hypothetical protein [Halocynthiibacter namhaensis]|uniref:hypothetical protein n=1 Tax=Halocynthiibacter namhaensis TaxID=1290553 RepID=UPI0006920E3B|nr:hypothetical protein [Halocynthiibacter namhaensis]
MATPSTVEGISQTIQLKYDFWGPILGDNAPTDLIVPEVLEGRDDWRMNFDVIEGLNPKRVIAGHSVGDSAEDISIVEFTRSYVAAFEAAAEVANSEELVAAMQVAYPDFAVNSSLEIGAAVLMGERSWP